MRALSDDKSHETDIFPNPFIPLYCIHFKIALQYDIEVHLKIKGNFFYAEYLFDIISDAHCAKVLS